MNYETASLELLVKKFSHLKEDRLAELSTIKKWSAEPGHFICIFGAGSGGKAVFYWYSRMGIQIDYYCDNDPARWGTTPIGNIICISPADLEKRKENTLCVLSMGTRALESVFKQLETMEIPHLIRHTRGTLFDEVIHSPESFNKNVSDVCDRMQALFEYLEDEYSKKVIYYKLLFWMCDAEELNKLSLEDIYTEDQYFIQQGRFLNAGETIADCGAFDGDTLDYFIKHANCPEFNKYICFEPDCDNYKRLKMRVQAYPEEIRKRVVLYSYGVGRQRKKEEFGEILSLDQIDERAEISMLKMDIEGYELEALKGAQRLIRENRPFCAICVYHKFSDIWEIPLYLKQLVPEYRIILRHHQYSYSETVCYAFIEGSDKCEQIDQMEGMQ